MPKEEVLSLQQLQLQGQTAKGCAIGVVIDVTSAYYDEAHKHYMCKLKIVDESMNQHTLSKSYTSNYCLVMVFAPTAEQLPLPRCLGDIIYLRRFAFGRFNDQFQAKNYIANYISWFLLPREGTSLNCYQSNRLQTFMDQAKYSEIAFPVLKLRAFADRYIQQTSLTHCNPFGTSPTDSDAIVLVLRASDQGFRVKFLDKSEAFLPYRLSHAKPNDICKIRSIVRFENSITHGRIIISNNFTSLTPIPKSSCNASHLSSNIDCKEEKETSVPLSTVLSLAIPDRKYRIRCEVGRITPDELSIKYYADHRLHDTPVKNSQPVYKINFFLTDDSLGNGSQFVEAFLLSYDGQGSKFVPRIDLESIQYSTLEEEKQLYYERCEELLNAAHVDMLVELIGEGKNKLLRVLSVL